jgi:hypothetical protein
MLQQSRVTLYIKAELKFLTSVALGKRTSNGIPTHVSRQEAIECEWLNRTDTVKLDIG